MANAPAQPTAGTTTVSPFAVTGSSVGAVIAPLAIAQIATGLGWRWVFYITGGLGFIGASVSRRVGNATLNAIATYDAITSHDFAVIQGFTLVIAIGFLIVNLLVDLSYAILDPRIRLG